MYWYIIGYVVLVFAFELVYFKIAEHFNIIDKPNERSSHSRVVLRGGGIIFIFGVLLWAVMQTLRAEDVEAYLPFVGGLILIGGISFMDDVKPLPDSVRLVVHFVSMLLLFMSLGILKLSLWWLIIIALIVSVGIINVYNFMDGINGITGGYSLSVLLPLLIANSSESFTDNSLIITSIISVSIFCIFNFRPKNKAKCFAGDVGSVSMAFILIYLIGSLIISKGDVSYLIFMIVYGVDACLTIVHRILLHENLGKAHRKHAYQIMANELGLSHITVSLLYMLLQLIISIVFIYLIPDTVPAHWIYLSLILVSLCLAYIIFMKKYYHLHEEYLQKIQS